MASIHVMSDPPPPSPSAANYSIAERRDSVYTEAEGGGPAKVCSASFQEECAAIEKRLKSHEKGVLNPDSPKIQRWDSLTFALLIFTAIFTPFEVAYLEVKSKEPLFVINRFVDAVFLVSCSGCHAAST